VSSKLTIKDREALTTQQKRIVGTRPYENGVFGQHDEDFILFELYDVSGNLITYQNILASFGTEPNTEFNLALYPSTHIQNAGFSSGTFTVKYHFLRRVAGTGRSVLVKTKPLEDEGQIYSKTNDFHITEDGLIFEGTEEDWQQSAPVSLPLRIEDLTYQVDAISPSRTEIRLKAKNIKGSYQEDFYKSQEGVRFRTIGAPLNSDTPGDAQITFTSTDGTESTSKTLAIISPNFQVATNGGFADRMIGGTITIPDVYKISEVESKVRTEINLISNGGAEDLKYNLGTSDAPGTGELILGMNISSIWDEYLHNAAVHPQKWTSGFQPFDSEGDWQGTAGYGFHAHWARGEGVDGSTCMKFPDTNLDFIDSPGWNGNEYRPLRIQTEGGALTTLLSQGASAGDTIHISFDMKASIAGKGVNVYLRYGQAEILEDEPAHKLVLDISNLEGEAEGSNEENPGDNNPPEGYVSNTYGHAQDYESLINVSLDSNLIDPYITDIVDEDDNNWWFVSYDLIPNNGTSPNGYWKYNNAVEYGTGGEAGYAVAWQPNLHDENLFGTQFSKNGALSAGGNWAWNSNQERWISNSSGLESLLDLSEPTVDAPTSPPEEFVPNTTEGASSLENQPQNIIQIVLTQLAEGYTADDVQLGATSEIIGGMGVWVIGHITHEGGSGQIQWSRNSTLLNQSLYSRRGALDESQEWQWDGTSWIPVYFAPDYSGYLDLIEYMLANNLVSEPSPGMLPVINNSTSQNIAGNYFDTSNNSFNSSGEFYSPDEGFKWDGTEWVNLQAASYNDSLYVVGRDGASEIVSATTSNEWSRYEVNITIPERFRLDMPYNIGFYGHSGYPGLAQQQGIVWVDNVFADLTFESQTTTKDVLRPYITTITGVLNSSVIQVEDSWEDVRLKLYDVESNEDNMQNFSNSWDYATLSYVVNNQYDLRTYLMRENDLFLTTNFKRDAINNPHYPYSIVYKMYKPLPPDIRRFDEFVIVKEMMDPVTDSVKIVDFIDTEVGDIVLKTPDINNIEFVSRQATDYKNETEILTDDASISNKLRNEFISQSFESVELNTDYGQFKNFVNFSSIEKRIRNFKYKLELLESYSDSSGSLVGISGSLDDRKSWQTKIDDIKNNFDEFESYMYHKSSSRSSGSLGIFYSNAWPKTGGSGSVQYPYTLAHTTSSQGQTFFANQMTSASIFDTENLNRLSYHLPAYLTEDSENLDFTNFVDMVAQHFDQIWLYTKSITDTYDRREKLDEGVSKELLYTMAKSLGWQFPNAKDLVDLPRYAYGVEVTGSSYSDYSAVSDRDISREIWSRIINNMPFFLKNKGTIKALKGLINVYGIPSTILRVKEYGGPDLPDTKNVSYEITRKFTKALDFRSGQYVRTTWTDDGFTSRKPDTVEFRFRAATGSNQILVEKQSTTTDQDWVIRLKDNNSSDNYGYVSFLLSGSAVGTSVGQYKELTSSAMPVYDGDFYSVMVQRSSGSDNPNVSQSYELHVGKYDAGMSRINLYSKSTMNVDVAASASFNLAWTGSGDVYIGGRADITGTGIRLSGSIMEYRHWTEALQTSSFRNHIANPKAYDGNSVSSSYKHLTLRYSFDDNQDLSTYAGGVLDSRAEQQKAYSGSYVGFTGNFFSNVVDELKTHIPSIGALRRTTKKIRLESNEKVLGNLDANRRVTVGAYDTAPLDSNRVGVYFAPTDVINTDIINSVANLNYDNYLGDPRDFTKYDYRGLEYVADNYWKKYNSPNNFWDYIRILKYYDQSMFPQIKKMIPARAKSRVGVLVEPNILERSKIIKGRDPDAGNFFYSASVDYRDHITISSSYNAGTSVTTYDSYTGRIPVYSYETGSSYVSSSGQYSTYEASGSEVRDRFTEGSIWSRLNNNDAFYSHSTITYGDVKYAEVLQPIITGSRMYGRNQKIRKFYSTAASASADNYHSSSWKNVDLDPKAEENEALFNMLYAGVKNTLKTTLDGGSPIEVVVTAPTKLVTTKTAESSLKTGYGKEAEFKDKKKKKQGKKVGDKIIEGIKEKADGKKSFVTKTGKEITFDSVDELTKNQKDELTKKIQNEIKDKEKGNK
tara:strand:+ start:6474 stop:12662 length:6189 start_codon:yes stop_codon:yes gene_type:complete